MYWRVARDCGKDIYYTNGEWGAPEVLKTLKTPKICSPCKTTTASFYFFVCFSFTMAVIYWTQEYYFLLYSLIVSSSKISLLQFTETKTYFRNYFFRCIKSGASGAYINLSEEPILSSVTFWCYLIFCHSGL